MRSWTAPASGNGCTTSTVQKFVGREATLVEIGVYSGGSLGMWRRYLGAGCRIHGIDIESACRIYETEGTTIHVGDQSDRAFWRRFRQSVPAVEVLIDDGGHDPEQQMVTLEEMPPHLRPGGVFVCEDVHGVGNEFASFVEALSDALNAFSPTGQSRDLGSVATAFQAAVASIHLYPFAAVIEMANTPVERFQCPQRGTQWQRFAFTNAREPARAPGGSSRTD